MKKLLFTLCLLATLAPSFAQKTEYKIAAIGFYNLENLFDTLDSPDTNDKDFLPKGRLKWNTERYVSKQANMAIVISQIATDQTPDGLALLGVAEIENQKVLEDLVAQPQLAPRNYRIVHFESPDERGIDCALLYQPKYFTVLGAQAVPVKLVDAQTGEVDFTRDILYVAGIFDGEPMHLMVGHWPSRSGGEAGSVWRRGAAASVCKMLSDSILNTDPNAKIVIMGDFNDDPTSKSVAKVLQAKGKSEDVPEKGLYNPMYSHFKDGNGTLAYRDAWNLFDQMVVSKGMINKSVGGWQLHKAVIFRQPWLMQTEGAFRGYPFRTFVGDIFMNGYSDHLPVYLTVLRKK